MHVDCPDLTLSSRSAASWLFSLLVPAKSVVGQLTESLVDPEASPGPGQGFRV